MSRTIEVPEYEVHDEVRVDPARTALVVVDMQNDFVRAGGSLRGPDAEATIPRHPWVAGARPRQGNARGAGRYETGLVTPDAPV
jgi:hypothetical protein